MPQQPQDAASAPTTVTTVVNFREVATGHLPAHATEGSCRVAGAGAGAGVQLAAGGRRLLVTRILKGRDHDQRVQGMVTTLLEQTLLVV